MAAPAGPTIIDMYCHIFPDAFFREMTRIAPKLENIGQRLRGVKKLFDLDERFREMDQFGDYRQIISLPNPSIEDIASASDGLQLAKVGNDAMAELCRKHKQRFPTFVAAVCLTDIEGSIAEVKRAVNDLGARGVQIFAHIAGTPLDDPRFEPFYAAVAELDVPIWLHPVRTAAMPDFPGEKKSRFEMWWCFGWPLETSITMVRLVFSGLFDRYPELRFVTHHLGGMIPYYDGRVGPGLQVLGQRTSDEDYSQVLSSLKRPHMDYLKEFYADTAMFGGGIHAIRCGLDFFGTDHVVFATDAPLGPIAPTIQVMSRLALEPHERRKLMVGNAEKLLKLNFTGATRR
jgi:aminocarboxymuconate-semialdehyde decarboxylase